MTQSPQDRDPRHGEPGPGGLDRLAQAARGLPPVHLWDPPHCGDIDIVIRRDGVWTHEGSPIGRPELVRLFSTVLRRDPDGYYLVTPVEKLRITVEDLPFRAVACEIEGPADDPALTFVTDVGDRATAGPDHPIVVETDPATHEPQPRVHVRGDLWARISRPVFYDLVEGAVLRDGRLWVRSCGVAFALGAADEGSA